MNLVVEEVMGVEMGELEFVAFVWDEYAALEFLCLTNPQENLCPHLLNTT